MAANINQNTDIILQYHDIIKNIYTASVREIEGIPLTRLAIVKSDPSCRLWQLFLCLLNVLERKTPGTISHLISVANKSNQLLPFQRDFKILLKSISNNNSLLHQLFIKTKITENVKKIESVDELQQGFNYLCICKLDPKNPRNELITHFFIIIRMGNQFFVDSTYGSYYIHTPPYFQEVNLDEIQMLIQSLSDLRDVKNRVSLETGPMQFITKFYNTYFFKGNIPKYPNEGNIANRSQPISNPEKKQIVSTFFGEYQEIYVGLIYDYEQLLDEYITDLGLTFKNSSSKTKSSQYGPVKKPHNKTMRRIKPYQNTQSGSKKPLPGHTNGGKRRNSITYKNKRRYF